MSLKQAFGSFLWASMESLVLKGISFFVIVIISRWIGPSEYGLIGIISIFMLIGNALVDSGLSASLIRSKNVDDVDYSTVFYVNIIISIFLYVFIFAAAPIIAEYFKEVKLVLFVRVYCLIFIIRALSAVHLARLIKLMQFKKIALIAMPSTIIGSIFGLIMAFNECGAWSIVAMYMATDIIMNGLLWFHSGWLPSLVFSRYKLIQHWSFGYKLFISSILNQLFDNIYTILIGRSYSMEILGYYDRAKKFNEYPSTSMTSVITRVTYPLLSRVQDDRQRLTHTYRELIRFSFFIMAPLMLGAAAISRPLFLILLGSSWERAVPFFQILSLSAMFYPIHALNITILKVVGRSDLFLKLEMLKKVAFILPIIVGFKFGIEGLLWCSVLVSLINLLINIHFSSKFIDYNMQMQLKDAFPILVASGLMYFIMYSVLLGMQNIHSLIQMIVSIFLGSAFFLYIGTFMSFKPTTRLFDFIRLKLVKLYN